MNRHLLLVGAFVALATVNSLAAQGAPLRIERDGRPAVLLSPEALRRLPSDTISQSSHGAPPVRYRAVKLIDVMAAAGSPIDSLRLGHAGWIVIGFGSDGYVALFSAGELDPKLGPTRAWIALDRDGMPLEPTEAPYHLIVASDLHGSRSARMITMLRITNTLPPAKAP